MLPIFLRSCHALYEAENLPSSCFVLEAIILVISGLSSQFHGLQNAIQALEVSLLHILHFELLWYLAAMSLN